MAKKARIKDFEDVRMLYPFNEPIQVNYKMKKKFLSFLNKLPYRNYFLLFLKNKCQKLSKWIDEEIYVNERIVEHGLIFKNIELEKGRVLDVGCCESKLVIELASMGYDVYGVDQADYPLRHPNFHFVKTGVTKLPFPDNFFDRILAISTIEHIGFGVYGDVICEEGDKKAIMEMKRVLKKNGKMLITVPYGGKPWRKSSYWYNRCSWYNESSLKELLKDFDIERENYYIKRGECWVPCFKKDANNVSPDSCIVFLKLSVRGGGFC